MTIILSINILKPKKLLIQILYLVHQNYSPNNL